VNAVDWLLDSDPAIRWQAMRDLTDASPAAIATERARVGREGLGAEILARQGADGAWRRADGRAWAPTLFTLLLLRAAGADPADPAVESAVTRLETTLRWDNHAGPWDLRPVTRDANPFFEGEVEPCINGGVLALGGYFGRPTARLAHRLLGEQQVEDGGWNCDAPASVRSSFHTTFCVLDGLLAYEQAVGAAPEVAAARRRAEEYLLVRHLFRRRSTGEVVNPEFLEFAFPPRYNYDVLRALDYFRAAGAPPDPRMGEAVDLIIKRQQADGRWLLDRSYGGVLAVSIGETVGAPSRWNTLRALRVLRWYQPDGLGHF
jgi:hypothetical protein